MSLEFVMEFGVSKWKSAFWSFTWFWSFNWSGLRCYSCLIPRYLTMLGRIPLLIPVLLMLRIRHILVQMVCEDTQASLLSGKRLNFVKLVWVSDGRFPCCSTPNIAHQSTIEWYRAIGLRAGNSDIVERKVCALVMRCLRRHWWFFFTVSVFFWVGSLNTLILRRRRCSIVVVGVLFLIEEVTNKFGLLRPGFLAGSPSCLMHDRCCDSCPLLSNRDSSGAKKRSMMGFQFFLAYFRSIYYFQGSNGWAWVWCLSDGGFTVSVSSNWILACSIIDGGGNQFAGAYSILV